MITPWSIQNDCICLPNGRAILSVEAIGGETEAEVKDNIAVIAAAPELLDLAKAFLAHLAAEKVLKTEAGKWGSKEAAYYDKLRAAIAKATGK